MSTPARHRSGSGRGGQFATSQHPETDVALDGAGGAGSPDDSSDPPPRPDYRQAAQDYLDHPENRDGWLVDPEAMLALDEHTDAGARHEGVALVDTYRQAWRSSAARYRATGDISDAAFMVAIEETVERQGIGRATSDS